MKPASALVALLLTRVGQRYVLGAKAPKDDARYAGPWDCAELASWGVYQTVGVLFGVSGTDPRTADAYSGHWARDGEALPLLNLGQRVPESGARVPIAVGCNTPGAVLVRRPQAGLTGHVAVSQGEGRTVEAYDSSKGVIESKSTGRRWDLAVLVPGLVFDVRSAIITDSPPVLAVGSKGEDVRRVQTRLNELQYPGAPWRRLVVDGDYGVATAHAVAAFQRDRGLVADGETGPITRKALGIA